MMGSIGMGAAAEETDGAENCHTEIAYGHQQGRNTDR